MLPNSVFVFCALFVLTWGNTQYAGNGHGSGGEFCYVPRHTKIVALTELPPSYGLQDNVAFLKKGASMIIECEAHNPLTNKRTSYLKAFKCDGHSQMYASCYNKGVALTVRNLLVLYKEVHSPHEAERQCLLKGGTMASITGANENSMAVSLMAYANVQTALIGLTDRYLEGFYKWMDGSTSRWSNWYRGYPKYSTPQPNDNGMGEDYVVIQREGANGRWFDVGPPRHDSPLSTFETTGNNSFSYLCKFSKITFTVDGYVIPNYSSGHGCPGGSVPSNCANQCSHPTCSNLLPFCYSGRNFPCISGCVCPDNLPVLDDNRCITKAQCSAPEPTSPKCAGGQFYDSCANACSQQTCTDLYKVCAFTAKCIGGCKCPADRPFLHKGECLTKTECSKPTPPSPKCSGGQVYDSCANACTQQTCDDRVQACANGPCYAGCKCPASKPFLHYGRCVTEASCPRSCRNNQVYQSCASLCPKTCSEPEPRGAVCSACASGCACPPHLPILHNGWCIAQRQCPGRQCDSNLVYDTCASPCTATCDDPSPTCTLSCAQRCACPYNLPILHNGRCITERLCPREPQCDSNLVYQTCASSCTATCDTPNPVCNKRCALKCACPANLPILHEGSCIARRSCPREPLCGSNLVYNTCASSCTATCDDPDMARQGCTAACVAKCACPASLPVLHQGRCIAQNQCPIRTGRCRGTVGSYRDECDNLCTCNGGTLDYCCRERKAFSSLTSSEKTRFLRAMVTISSDPTHRREWLRLTKIHVDNFNSDIHEAAQFLPWHREYLYLYEDLLRKVDCRITLPFWDWTKEREGSLYGSQIFSTRAGFGGDGARFTGCISGDYFRNYKLSNNQCVRRSFLKSGNCAAARWPTITQMKKLVTGQPNQASFETFIRGVWHNTIHNCFGADSTLRGFSSAQEPLFALHHAMVDYAWWSWQNYHDEYTFPGSANRLRGFSNKRISSVLVSERIRAEEGVCYRPQPDRDLASREFQDFKGSGGARNLPEEGCAMDPEDTLADKLTEEELKAIADMNQLLGIGSNC